jgi:hypothetical protein
MYSSAADNKTEKLQYANENMITCSAFEDFDEPYQLLYLYVLASFFLVIKHLFLVIGTVENSTKQGKVAL